MGNSLWFVKHNCSLPPSTWETTLGPPPNYPHWGWIFWKKSSPSVGNWGGPSVGILGGGPSVGFLRKGQKPQKNVYFIQTHPRSRVKKAYLFVKMAWQCRQNDPLRYEKRGKEHEQTLLFKQKHKLFKGEEKSSQLLMMLNFLNKTVEGILAKYPTERLTRGGAPLKIEKIQNSGGQHSEISILGGWNRFFEETGGGRIE